MSMYTAARGLDVRTGADSRTSYFEEGKQVYPCQCGEIHRGDYAFEDWNHPNCLHSSPLLLVEGYQAICGECGRSWQIISIDP